MKIIFSDTVMSENDEKIILISLVGIFESLKNDSMSIDEAEKFLFSPYMINKLRAKNCNLKIIDILEKGCELENIASLIPEKLLKIINELKEETLEVMKEYGDFNKTVWVK